MKFALLGAAALAGALISAGPSQAQNTLTVVSWGGQYQADSMRAWFEPAAQALGIRLREDTIRASTDLRAHVRSGNVVWDVVDLGGTGCEVARQEQLVEPLDMNVINAAGINPKIVNEAYVGILQFSTVLGYNRQKYGANPPRNWADFFDVQRFPGTRALYARPQYMLEIALLADGVPADRLYPLDVERAIRKLETIRRHVTVFYNTGGHSTQLVRDGEVDMIPIFENRLYAAQAAGAQYDFTFNQGIVDIDCLVIPKGSRNVALAQRFIAQVVSPQINGRIAEIANQSPTNSLSFGVPGLISPERARRLSSHPENLANQIFVDLAYWGRTMNDNVRLYDAMRTRQ